ncbi:MAG: hypothetical protein JSR45_16100 [Proteobacteria bacterium]|nr:hypothetical protein [Pseudomonadota bacterium]
MPIDHGGGRLGLIDWQGRRKRAPGLRITGWGLALIACAAAGVAMLTAQLVGAVAWTGPLAAVPAALVLLVIGAQFVAGVRAILGWFAK